MIRYAEPRSLPRVLEIYAHARRFMEEHGNPAQWAGGYPPESLLRGDMAQRALLVVERGGEVHGVFAFFIGAEPTYARIGAGAWLSDSGYGTLHRVAGSGAEHGILREAVAWCWQKSRICG